MIQYFSVNGKEYPFLLANRQLRRFLAERKLKLSQLDEVLLDMDAMHQLFTLGVASGLQKLKISERVSPSMIDEWNEDGHLSFMDMMNVINSAIKPNLGMDRTDDATEPGPSDEGN